MNPTNIEWCDLTWNPITGCHHGCEFCYARRFAHRLRGRFGYPADDPFAPTFHEGRVVEPFGAVNQRIFTVSMGDIFSPGVEKEWVAAVLDVMRNDPGTNRYFILTKNPIGWRFNIPPAKLWCGVSVATKDDFDRIEELRLTLGLRGQLFVSIEPLMGPMDNLDLEGMSWVIVGAETGNRKGKIAPKLEWVRQIVEEADRHKIPVFMKDSLKSIPGIEAIWRRELEAPK